MIALSMLRALADRDMAVPGRVRVVGYDDLPLAAQAVPRITTVRQDFATGARAMVERLFARMADRPARSLQLEPSLVVRDSTRS